MAVAESSKSPGPRRLKNPRDVIGLTVRRRHLADRGAYWTVVGGGVAIISAIFAILFFIVIEVLPVLSPAKVEITDAVQIKEAEILALVGDEYRSQVAVVSSDGYGRILRLSDGAEVAKRLILDPGLRGTPENPDKILAGLSTGGNQALAVSTRSGRIFVVPVRWLVTFDEKDNARIVTGQLVDAVELELDPDRGALGAFAISVGEDDDGAMAAAAQLADGTLALVLRKVTENMFTGESTSSTERFTAKIDGQISAMVLDRSQRNLYAGTQDGTLYWWKITAAGMGEPQVQPATRGAVTSLSFLLGERAIVVGGADGSISVWFLVRKEEGSSEFRLTRIRDFPPRPEAVTSITPSLRNRTFLVQDRGGEIGLYYSTSERVLWTGTTSFDGGDAITFFAPRGDGILLAGGSQIKSYAVDNPHPEISWSSLFSKVWYESYEEPAYIWQSSGATDDNEAKISLTPLLSGTLKGTIYALILAIPLAVLGAMYTSQFMHPRLQGYVKPAVEIMAALPSVILGFLAGLWLAPQLESYFPALLLSMIFLPITVILAGRFWEALPPSLRNRWPAGSEVMLFMTVLACGAGASVALSPACERIVFGGNFQAWLEASTGLVYDQRNAVVIGLAMGFAVIPIIFTIAEEAFSSVPRNLVAGSLALGATRWQTVSRVVLPTASPGVFSGIMVGFGRAVGETMIVLMATGNTPIMDWNIFNGFRTLSANVAVEIPEAPHGGTLYRTLFLAALLLFVVTFLLNTVADVIRQRLRKRYAQL